MSLTSSLLTTPPGVLDYFAGVRARVAPRRVLFAFEQGPKTKLSAAERALLRQLCLSVGLRSGSGGGGGAAPTDNLAESYLTGEEPEVRCDTMCCHAMQCPCSVMSRGRGAGGAASSSARQRPPQNTSSRPHSRTHSRALTAKQNAIPSPPSSLTTPFERKKIQRCDRPTCFFFGFVCCRDEGHSPNAVVA